MAKLKKDCTPEEWARRLARQRKVNAAITADPERKPRYREKARIRQAERMRDAETQAAAKARQKLANATPLARKRDRERNALPERKRAAYARHIRLRYSLTPDDLARILERQRNACAVCGRAFGAGDGEAKSRHVDHCHATGVVRGLLCATCNSLEGKIRALGFTPAGFAQRLQQYLDNPPAQQEEELW